MKKTDSCLIRASSISHLSAFFGIAARFSACCACRPQTRIRCKPNFLAIPAPEMTALAVNNAQRYSRISKSDRIELARFRSSFGVFLELDISQALFNQLAEAINIYKTTNIARQKSLHSFLQKARFLPVPYGVTRLGPRNRNMTSLMGMPSSSMVRRSTPRPKPPWGGQP